MKSALLALTVLIAGLVAVQSLTHAKPQNTNDTPIIEMPALSSLDVDRINGIVDERIDPTVSRINEELASQDSRLGVIEAKLAEALTQITDCSTRTAEVIAAQKTSSGGSTGNVAKNVYQSTTQTKSASGGSTGTPVPNAYTQYMQPAVVVTETPTVTTQPILSRSVTRTQTNASAFTPGDCPGGVCPTSYGQTSTTRSNTLSVPRLRIFRR
jgi:hypothetical protein